MTIRNRTSKPISGHARILSDPDSARCLDPVQLEKLEKSFRAWAGQSHRPDLELSRKRILLIFLIIRYTGARLSEVLNLDPIRDMDYDAHSISFRKEDAHGPACREVQIPEKISGFIREAMEDPPTGSIPAGFFRVDPAHVRRKFYARAQSCGLPRELGAPEAIRRSRAVELMQNDMPLPVVQKILGHSTPNLAASYVKFSDEEIRQVARHFADREDRRKTSARNAFFGKIVKIRKGDVQAMVEVASVGGQTISAVITNQSLTALGLKPGTLVVAEVKAPWVLLYTGDKEPGSTAENRFRGTVSRIVRGKTTAEVVVGIAEGMEVCSVITEGSRQALGIQENDTLWVAFNAFAVVLHLD
jgi:molybdate transport system regulatory protein